MISPFIVIHTLKVINTLIVVNTLTVVSTLTVINTLTVITILIVTPSGPALSCGCQTSVTKLPALNNGQRTTHPMILSSRVPRVMSR